MACLDSFHDRKLISFRRVGWPNRWHWLDYQNLVKLGQQNVRQQMTTALRSLRICIEVENVIDSIPAPLDNIMSGRDSFLTLLLSCEILLVS